MIGHPFPAIQDLTVLLDESSANLKWTLPTSSNGVKYNSAVFYGVSTTEMFKGT